MEVNASKLVNALILALLILQLANTLPFYLDVSYPLVLPCQVIELYQLSNSSILI